MVLKFKIFILVFFISFSIFTSAQVAVGQWQDHSAYNNAQRIVEGDEFLYVLTDVGLFSKDYETGELSKLNRIDPLSDIQPTAIDYSESAKALVIGYANGNLDILKNNTMFNVSDIKRKALSTSKRINDILIIDDLAYLSTGFGIVVLDLEKKEIKSTFYIGNNGTYVYVNELATDGENLYAATEIGIYKGNLNEFLVDFSNWEILTELSEINRFSWMNGSSFNTIEFFNDKLFVNYNAPNGAYLDTLCVYENETWDTIFTRLNQQKHLWSNGELMSIASQWSSRFITKTLEDTLRVYSYRFTDGSTASTIPNSLIIDSRGTCYIADERSGLISYTVPWSNHQNLINGPNNKAIFRIASVDDVIYGVAGGYNGSYTASFSQARGYMYRDNIWFSFDDKTNDELVYEQDLSCVVVDPNNKNHAFLGSWRKGGIMEILDNQIINKYSDENSPLEAIIIGAMYDYRISSMVYDEDDNLWITTSDTEMPIVIKMEDGSWESLDYSAQINHSNIGQIAIDHENNKWVVLPRGGGVFVFNDNGTPGVKSDDDYRKLTIRNEDGEIVSNEVYSIAVDKDGYVWVGTNSGPVVYYNPEDVFTESTFLGNQVKIPRNDGTNSADLLLLSEIITSIRVDGANQKWFGTQTGGAFMTSEDGVELMHSFNTDNSPILSNQIYDIAIVPATGEVVFATPLGAIGYMGESTEGGEEFEEVYAFPNPVNPEFDGKITIRGLIAGSIVKITDISGDLVAEMKSNGGSAIWDGKNGLGNRVKTGIYLVFISNPDGSKTEVTKIAFIN